MHFKFLAFIFNLTFIFSLSCAIDRDSISKRLNDFWIGIFNNIDSIEKLVSDIYGLNVGTFQKSNEPNDVVFPFGTNNGFAYFSGLNYQKKRFSNIRNTIKPLNSSSIIKAFHYDSRKCSVFYRYEVYGKDLQSGNDTVIQGIDILNFESLEKITTNWVTQIKNINPSSDTLWNDKQKITDSIYNNCSLIIDPDKFSEDFINNIWYNKKFDSVFSDSYKFFGYFLGGVQMFEKSVRTGYITNIMSFLNSPNGNIDTVNYTPILFDSTTCTIGGIYQVYGCTANPSDKFLFSFLQKTECFNSFGITYVQLQTKYEIGTVFSNKYSKDQYKLNSSSFLTYKYFTILLTIFFIF